MILESFHIYFGITVKSRKNQIFFSFLRLLGWVECQTSNQAAQVRILANNNGFLLSFFLAPGGSEPT